MSIFAQHIQGQGSQCLEALNKIREIQSQILEDYYQNIRDMTETERDLANFNCDATVAMAEAQRQSMNDQAVGQIVGGALSIATATGALIGTGIQSRSLNKTNNTMDNIEQSIEITQNSSLKNSSLEGKPNAVDNPITPQEREEFLKKLSEKSFETSRFNKPTERPTQDQTIKITGGGQFSDIDAIEALDGNQRTTLKENLERKQKPLQRKHENSLRTLNFLTGILQSFPSTFNSISTGVGGSYAANQEALKGRYDADSKTIQANQQTAKDIDQLSQQGTSSANQDIQQTSRAFQTIISSETQRA